MKINKIVFLVFIMLSLSFFVFEIIYRSNKKKEDQKPLLFAIEKIENDFMILKFHGVYDGRVINNYTRIMWGLDTDVVSLEEYSIHDLDEIPVYEILFERKKEYMSLMEPTYGFYFWIGKYREPGGKWIYFSSPDLIRNEFRRLLKK